MFPQIPLNLITEDLSETRSVELTVENILEARLVAPPFRGQQLLQSTTNTPLSVLQTSSSSQSWDQFSDNTDSIEP